MNRRRVDLAVGANVAVAIAQSKVDPSDVALAAGLDVQQLETRLSGDAGFTVAELVQAGGFLRLPIPSLVEGVTA